MVRKCLHFLVVHIMAGVFAATYFTGHNNFNCKETCIRDINLPKYGYTVFGMFKIKAYIIFVCSRMKVDPILNLVDIFKEEYNLLDILNKETHTEKTLIILISSILSVFGVIARIPSEMSIFYFFVRY